jgi:bifunctional non-homologous end joining protein LigD
MRPFFISACFRASFISVADGVRTVHADRAILDGEIIAISEKGEISFQHLQHRGSMPEGWHIVFCAFDLLNLEGDDLRESPLQERRRQLERVVARSGVLLSVTLAGTLKDLVATGKEAKREGIVAKRRQSIYESGGHSSAWQKLQLKPQQEFVIGGYRPGGKSNLELLLVGFYENGKLLYAGKVRNALNQFNRKELFDTLHPLKQKKCSFANLPNSRRDHFGESVTAEEMNDYAWLKPKIVAQVKFAEWTKGNVLRHAEFAGLRDDKDPDEVRKES